MGIRPSQGRNQGVAKSLLLGAAAGFVALTGAQAADLPGKAAPAEYVRICDTYGAGFIDMIARGEVLRLQAT